MAGLAQAEVVTIGSVLGITGPVSQSADEVLKVTEGYVEMINARGGINGNHLAVTTRDDRYDPAKTASMVEDAIVRDRVVAFVNGIGTSGVISLVKSGVLNKYKTPLVGVFSGSQALRGPGAEYIFHTRGSYRDEVMKISRLLSTLGLKRVALLYQDDGFGADILSSMTDAEKKFGFEIVAKAPYQSGETNFRPQESKITAAHPQAILLMGVPPAVYRFLQVYKQPVGAAQLYTLSIVTPMELAKFAGVERIRGIGISQVVPNPKMTSLPLSKDFSSFLKTPFAKGVNASPFTFEAYMNIRLTVEAIAIAGPHPTPEKVAESLKSMHNYFVGGFPINFTQTNREGSSYLDMAVIGPQGSLLY